MAGTHIGKIIRISAKICGRSPCFSAVTRTLHLSFKEVFKVLFIIIAFIYILYIDHPFGAASYWRLMYAWWEDLTRGEKSSSHLALFPINILVIENLPKKIPFGFSFEFQPANVFQLFTFLRNPRLKIIFFEIIYLFKIYTNPHFLRYLKKIQN